MIYLYICWFLKFLFNVQCLDVRDTVTLLSKEITSLQVQKDREWNPPFSFKEDRGLYPSHVKLNFHGAVHMAAIREVFKVFDNNMFATAWITSCLVEASVFGIGPTPAQEEVDMALTAISKYHDRNSNFNNSIMTFWPQVYNTSTKTWESTPSNLLNLFSLTDKANLKLFEDILRFIGLKDIAQAMETLLKNKSSFLRAFHIPPDFDDTFVNIGLGSLLKESSFQDQYQRWVQTNTNLTSAFDALKKYAYRPYSKDSNQNSIDPRTFFYLRNFLWENTDADVALVPTWIQNVEEAKKDYYNGVAMPFTINNVDVTVSANVIFGITASLLSGVVDKDIFDTELQNIYHHTSLMIAYEMNHNFSSRRDLALTYYPSKFECYWFVSRTVALLRRYKENNNLPFKVFETTLQLFDDSFNGAVLNDMLRTAIREDKRIFFDDFLGDGDLSIFGKPKNKAEDRLFTTSMALNTLIDAFTVFDNNKKLRWQISDTTKSKVKPLVEGCVTFLNDFILGRKYKAWNAFFSGSGKSRESMPFVYPANRLEFLNGTKFSPDKFPGAPFVIGFEGVVPKQNYSQMLKEKHFGEYTPIDFDGFNPPGEPEGFFPFWSSDAYTYATTMLSLSKYLNIVE